MTIDSSKTREAKQSSSLKIVDTAGRIEQRILFLRGCRVMLDEDLALLYDVTTKALIQSVKRNRERFPEDFCLLLTNHEVARLRSQIVTSKHEGRGGRRTHPYAFTEQGVAMLSSVLRSPRAIAVNIEIMRAFVKLRDAISSHKDLARKLMALEAKYDAQFKSVFDAICQLMAPPVPKRKPIGFIHNEE